MITFRVINDCNKYLVYYDQSIEYSALRVWKFNVFESIIFFDKENKEILRAKHKYFLLFNIGHKLVFTGDDEVYFLRSLRTGYSLNYKGNVYSVKTELFSNEMTFLINDTIVGSRNIINQKLYEYEHQIIGYDKEACFIFSIIDILTDWFDVN